jgi:iron complex transport system substrate-binding protein
MENNTKIIAIIAVVIIVIAGVGVALSGVLENKDKGFSEVTVTDSMGREVTISSIDRIVTVNSTTTEILCALGMSGNIVGTTSDSSTYDTNSSIIGIDDDDYPAAMISGLADGTIINLGGMYNISAETIASANPTVVFCRDYGTSQSTWDQLETLGIPCVVLGTATSIDDIYDYVEIVGKAVGKVSAAENMVSQMKNVVSKISAWCEKISDEHGSPTVAVMMTQTYACGGYISGTPILELIGATNVYDFAKYALVSSESLIEEDPDIIIYTNLAMGSSDTSAREFLNGLSGDTLLGDLKAVENNHVYATLGAASTAMSITSPNYISAIAMTAMFVYADYLGFDISNIMDDDNFTTYLSQFWSLINE